MRELLVRPLVLRPLVARALAACALVACRAAEPTPLETRWTTHPDVLAPLGGEDEGELVIGAWNLHYLGPSRRRPVETREVDDLVAVLEGTRADVLALLEVGHSGGEGEPLRNATLDEALAALGERTGGDWTYVLVPAQPDDVELMGLAWNRAAVHAVSEPFPLPVPLGKKRGDAYVLERPPHAFHVVAAEGRTDLVLVPLHLRSDFSFGDASDHRAEEARAIVVALDAVRERFADDDLVLLGDLNCPRADEETLRILADAGFRDPCGDRFTTHASGAPYDRILLADRPELPGELYVVTPSSLGPVGFATRASDHYPVVTRVRVVEDDD